MTIRDTLARFRERIYARHIGFGVASLGFFFTATPLIFGIQQKTISDLLINTGIGFIASGITIFFLSLSVGKGNKRTLRRSTKRTVEVSRRLNGLILKVLLK